MAPSITNELISLLTLLIHLFLTFGSVVLQVYESNWFCVVTSHKGLVGQDSQASKNAEPLGFIQSKTSLSDTVQLLNLRMSATVASELDPYILAALWK